MGFESIPAGALSAVLGLINAIVSVIQAGDDAKRREEALMAAAEHLKAEMDRLRFPGP